MSPTAQQKANEDAKADKAEADKAKADANETAEERKEREAKEKDDARKDKAEETAAKKGEPLTPRIPDDAVSEPEGATVSVATVEDKHGDERIVAPVYGEWEPAPVKSHPDEVKAHKQFLENQKKKRAQRADKDGK